MANDILRNCEHCSKEFAVKKFDTQSRFCSATCRLIKMAEPFHGGEGCWEWPMSRNVKTGYGQLGIYNEAKQRREPIGAHRLSWVAFNGDIPDGLHVLHKCDNRGCFNPEHLFLGTQKDNVSDMMNKGRQRYAPPAVNWQVLHPEKVRRGEFHHLHLDSSCLPRGEKHHNAKINGEDVLFIRSCSLTLRELSEMFGLSQSSLSSIRLKRTWAHI